MLQKGTHFSWKLLLFYKNTHLHIKLNEVGFSSHALLFQTHFIIQMVYTPICMLLKCL